MEDMEAGILTVLRIHLLESKKLETQLTSKIDIYVNPFLA